MCISCTDEGLLESCGVVIQEEAPVEQSKEDDRYLVIEGESKEDRKKRLAYESQKRRYEDRKAKGLCPNCGRDKNKDKPDQWLCDHCHEVRKKRNTEKEVYDKRKAEGICVRCGKEPAIDKRSVCVECGEKQRLRKRKTSEERKPKKVGKTYIQRRDEARAKGLCGGCMKRPAIEGKATCQTCLDRLRATYDKRVAEGLCAACGEPAEPEKKLCIECRDRHRARGNAKTKEFKEEAFAAYGGPVCVCCGEDIEKFLQLDHINNDGGEKRKSGEDGLGATLYGQLKRRGWPPGYQVLCASCNWGKHMNGGVCPHLTVELDLDMSGIKPVGDFHHVDLSDWSLYA